MDCQQEMLWPEPPNRVAVAGALLSAGGAAGSPGAREAVALTFAPGLLPLTQMTSCF